MVIQEHTAKALEEVGIIRVRGISGCDADLDTAKQAPQLCQVHSLAGDAYDIAFDGKAFTLSPAGGR